MSRKQRVVITGGAGFVGSNLCERFLAEDWQVVAVDNSLTGTTQNLITFMDDPDFELFEAGSGEQAIVVIVKSDLEHLAMLPCLDHQLPALTFAGAEENLRTSAFEPAQDAP